MLYGEGFVLHEEEFRLYWEGFPLYWEGFRLLNVSRRDVRVYAAITGLKRVSVHLLKWFE